MTVTYHLVVTLHLLAAMLWLGGMFFLALVGAPILRALEPPSLRQRLFHELGLRFRAVGWWAIGVLLITGVFLLQFRGLLRWSGVLGDPAFWGTSFGRALAAKLLAVALMIAVSFAHDFIVGPEAGRVTAGTPRAIALRRRAALMARANAVAGILLVLAAVRLARGG